MCTYFFVLLLLFATGSLGSVDFSGEYDVLQNVLLQYRDIKPVGYQISGKLNVIKKGLNVFLLKVTNPKFEVLSEGSFTPHSSALDNGPNAPFLIEVDGSTVSAVHLSQSDPINLRNLKRAVASLFQFQIIDGQKEEYDSSGKCHTRYTMDGSVLLKLKERCVPTQVFQKGIWGANLESERRTTVTLSLDKAHINSIVSSEKHEFIANFAQTRFPSINARVSVVRTGEISDNFMKYNDEVVLQTLIEIGGQFDNTDLTLEPEDVSCSSENCASLLDIVRAESSVLTKYGTARSAAAVQRITEAMRRSDEKDIFNVFKDKQFKKILPALLDCAGSSHTESVHQAALRRLRINTDRYNLDLTERYLWSLSVSPSASVNITRDVLLLMKDKHKDPKLQETLVLTAAALAKKVAQEEGNLDHDVVADVAAALRKELNACSATDEHCRQLHLKALGHMENSVNKPTLIKYALESTKKSAVRAMRGLLKLGQAGWDSAVLETAEKILGSVQADASARLTALDILLIGRPNKRTVTLAVANVFNRTPATKELATLTLAKLKHLASENAEASHFVANALNGMNWNISAVGGLSTSFKRDFGHSGYLSTDQELAGGVFKRGFVNVNLLQNVSSHTVFTLGMFASGLNSFVSQNEVESNEDGEEEEMMAGMELEVLGVELRPFVFFTGSGELMGHIWSGTASSDTPAYQASILVGLSEPILPLGCAGILAKVRSSTAASLQLSGEAEASLWNRNAHCVVRNSAALSLQGQITLETRLAKLTSEVELSTEPRLLLDSDIDFSGNTALCLKLDQPATYVKYHVRQTEKIVGKKHNVVRSRSTKFNIPGRTYALNQKNNDMCSMLNSD